MFLFFSQPLPGPGLEGANRGLDPNGGRRGERVPARRISRPRTRSWRSSGTTDRHMGKPMFDEANKKFAETRGSRLVDLCSLGLPQPIGSFPRDTGWAHQTPLELCCAQRRQCR